MALRERGYPRADFLDRKKDLQTTCGMLLRAIKDFPAAYLASSHANSNSEMTL